MYLPEYKVSRYFIKQLYIHSDKYNKIIELKNLKVTFFSFELENMDLDKYPLK